MKYIADYADVISETAFEQTQRASRVDTAEAHRAAADAHELARQEQHKINESRAMTHEQWIAYHEALAEKRDADEYRLDDLEDSYRRDLNLRDGTGRFF